MADALNLQNEALGEFGVRSRGNQSGAAMEGGRLKFPVTTSTENGGEMGLANGANKENRHGAFRCEIGQYSFGELSLQLGGVIFRGKKRMWGWGIYSVKTKLTISIAMPPGVWGFQLFHILGFARLGIFAIPECSAAPEARLACTLSKNH